MAAASYAASVGRWLMFNFGFGDVIDRFEKHFGPARTKLLLGIVAFTLAIFLIAFTVREAIYPAVAWTLSLLAGQPSEVARGLNWISTIIATLISVALIVVLARARNILADAKGLRDDAKALRSEAETALDQAQAALKKVEDIEGDLQGAKDRDQK